MDCNVLIIDDSAVDRSIMSMIIKKNIPGVHIYESDDGADIKALILQHHVKVCILDLKMPVKDGYQILAEMKEDPLMMDIPVIVCTGVMDTSSLEKVLTLGAYDYFSKPLSEEAMKISLPLKVRNAIDLMNRTNHIVHLSQIDSLTGLYNRHYFKESLMMHSAENELPISVLMFDINGLKVVNDAYGNELGDDFLISAAEIIQNTCPEQAVSARWGGDEFTVMLPSTDRHGAAIYALEVKSAFERILKKGLKLSMACGFDVKCQLDQDLLKVLSNAEDAMFRDKILEDVSIRSSMIGTILHTLHEKNSREEAHSRRVSEICQRMGEAMNLGVHQIQELKIMGLLHDIGKIAIDEHILNKPGKLSTEEWLEIKRHPEIGYRLLSSSKEMEIYARAVLSHHERYDGSGYPNGLKGQEIPEYARILTIADSYDAMTRERTYRKTATDQEAAEELLRCSGEQFDPELTLLFVDRVLGLADFRTALREASNGHST